MIRLLLIALKGRHPVTGDRMPFGYRVRFVLAIPAALRQHREHFTREA